ncbi:MAG TPA: amidase [Methylomirabilota bacterium]|jgi:Asp-tRNA(Asn)/Glu-tRNA(Gln) amidotransferase A subunit family amidase|nr:amidase [Methylomirabilota bacterium]
MNERRDLWEMSAGELAGLMGEGRVTAVEVVEACLRRIREIEETVQAWAFLDAEYAVAQAKGADERRLSGRPVGSLNGVPVGLKDIIDTADMPTENGSVLHAGRTPSRDAGVVERLRAAGAVILGKTVTTEFATRTPGKTRNPHNPAHTPGGSSSGSAAAVAAGMVPLSLGSQTGGSVIRPGAYCGVFALKPTHGLVSRHGMFRLSGSLDHVGLFARTVEDLALLLEDLAGYDERDPDSIARARAPYRALAAEEPPIEPRFGFFRSGRWSQVDADAQAALGELVEHLGGRVEEFDLSVGADELAERHRTVMDAEMAINLRREWETGRDRLSTALQSRISHGREVRAREYLAAKEATAALRTTFAELFEQRYDAILTPAAHGTAPAGLESTGEPTFNSMWTLLGLPAISVPLLEGANGLPLGVQLVGARDSDARLLRTARWLAESVAR